MANVKDIEAVINKIRQGNANFSLWKDVVSKLRRFCGHNLEYNWEAEVMKCTHCSVLVHSCFSCTRFSCYKKHYCLKCVGSQYDSDIDVTGQGIETMVKSISCCLAITNPLNRALKVTDSIFTLRGDQDTTFEVSYWKKGFRYYLEIKQEHKFLTPTEDGIILSQKRFLWFAVPTPFVHIIDDFCETYWLLFSGAGRVLCSKVSSEHGFVVSTAFTWAHHYSIRLIPKSLLEEEIEKYHGQPVLQVDLPLVENSPEHTVAPVIDISSEAMLNFDAEIQDLTETVADISVSPQNTLDLDDLIEVEDTIDDVVEPDEPVDAIKLTLKWTESDLPLIDLERHEKLLYALSTDLSSRLSAGNFHQTDYNPKSGVTERFYRLLLKCGRERQSKKESLGKHIPLNQAYSDEIEVCLSKLYLTKDVKKVAFRC